MSEQQWTAVDDYLSKTLVAADEHLTAALRASDEGGLPAIAVSPPQGKQLHLLAKIIGARNILEIGTLGGYSTIWMAKALPPDGKLSDRQIAILERWIQLGLPWTATSAKAKPPAKDVPFWAFQPIKVVPPLTTARRSTTKPLRIALKPFVSIRRTMRRM